MSSTMSRSLSSGKGAGAALMQGARFLSRYPFLVSTLSGLFSGRGRSRTRLLKAGVGVVAAWQMVKLLKPGQGSPDAS